VKVDRPPVVAEPLPGADDVVEAGRSERLDRRPALHPRLEPRNDASDLRLLEHHFGHEHRIWVAAPPPGKIAAVLGVPSKKRGLHGGQTT
jgi:hypothetical protein